MIAGCHGVMISMRGNLAGGARRTFERAVGSDRSPDYERDRRDLTQERHKQQDQYLSGSPVYCIYAELHRCCGKMSAVYKFAGKKLSNLVWPTSMQVFPMRETGKVVCLL